MNDGGWKSSYAVNNLKWHIFDFCSFLALVSHNRSRLSRSLDLILILGCMTSNLLVLEVRGRKACLQANDRPGEKKGRNV